MKKNPFFSNERQPALVIALVAVFQYVNTLAHQFALDDRAVIYENAFVKQGFRGFPDILTTFYWRGFWELNSGLYRPLSLLVFATEWQFFKDSPKAFHAVHVGLLALTCVLLYRMLRRLLRDYAAMLPFLAMLLFAVHPTHTEVGANLKSLDEVLSVLFFSLSFEQVLLFTDAPEKRPKHGWMAAGYFFLALLSKEGAILFLPVMALGLWYFRRMEVRTLIRPLALPAGAAVLWLGVHEAVIRSQTTAPIAYTYLDNSLVAASGWSERLATAMGMLGRYWAKLVIPWPLSYDYSFPEIPLTGWADGWVLLGVAGVAGLLVIAIRQMAGRTVLSFSLWWILITFALTSNVLVLIGATMADRFLFVPSLGACLALVWLLLHYTGTLKGEKAAFPPRPAGIALLLLLPYFALSISRNQDWKDDATLFTADVQHAPNSARVHFNYGTLLMQRAGQTADARQQRPFLDSAEAHFLIATRLDTGAGAWQAWQNLGVVRYRKKNSPGSVEATRMALRLNPGNQEALPNLADAFMQARQYDSAIFHLKRTIAANQIRKDTWLYLGKAWLEKKDTVQALTAFEAAVKHDPTYAHAWENYGNVLGMNRQYAASLKASERAYALDPGNPGPLNAMAHSYFFLKDTAKSREYARRYQQAIGK